MRGRWIVAVEAGRPPSAFDPTGPTGALAQTRASARADPAINVGRAPVAFATDRPAVSPPGFPRNVCKEMQQNVSEFGSLSRYMGSDPLAEHRRP